MQAWKKKVAKYTLLPGFIPRLYDLVGSGFARIAYFMAVIYQSVRLLPAGHPYLDPRNVGNFGIHHVIAQAASHLKFKKENTDQIIVFIVILAGLILLLLQIGLLFVSIIAQQPVFAMETMHDLLSVDSKYNPGSSQDLALITLDRVFGVKHIFNSCLSTGVPCLDLNGNPLPGTQEAYPTPFHLTLHTLLRFYSLGIFFVAVIIISYFVITIVAESAASGSPFGQRYNEAWVPIRLIVFFALLVPLNLNVDNRGLNGAQLITLWTAKISSNFATNAWGKFNTVLTASTYAGAANNLISDPKIPEVNDLIRYMFVAKVCQITEGAENRELYGRDNAIQAWVVRQQPLVPFIAGTNTVPFLLTNYRLALDFSNKGSITIRFGVHDPEKYKYETGNVLPVCGEIVFQNNKVDGKDETTSGTTMIQSAYYRLLQRMWTDPYAALYGECVRAQNSQVAPDPECPFTLEQPFAMQMISKYQQSITDQILSEIKNEKENADWTVPPELFKKGWAGAAIWYNRIAEMNGNLTSAARNMPQVSKWPLVFESVASKAGATNENVDSKNAFDVKISNNAAIDYERPKDRSLHKTMNDSYDFFGKSNDFRASNIDEKGNPILDFISWMFGTNGIYSVRQNPDTHPLALLSTLGKGMIDATLRNIALGKIGGFLGQKLGENGGGPGATLLKAVSTFIEVIGWATLSMGFIMYYVLPFMPFVYFLFAIGGWTKSIFEAVVGMPLWALGHIRIDGPGLPGPGATNGYFLLMEIFLRPILIVFGLLASITVFSSVVYVLNTVFDLVVSNLTGFDHLAESENMGGSKLGFYRGVIDQLFFTVIYVVMVYMMGLSCFKLIDAIPNSIIRWMGVSVSTFLEKAGDPAGELSSQVYKGTSLLGGKLRGGQVAALLN